MRLAAQEQREEGPTLETQQATPTVRLTMPTTLHVQSPLRHIDIEKVSIDALREARRREAHLPPVSVFRWWARRTESVVGALIDAVEVDRPGPLSIADPFAGGGTIALAAAIRGHRVYAQDINPWAIKGLTTSMTLPPRPLIEEAAAALHDHLAGVLADAYEVDGITVLRTMRVKVGRCPHCAAELRLYPTGLVSLERRVDRGGTQGWLACPAGHLVHGDLSKNWRCKDCHRIASPQAKYTAGGMITCFSCRKVSALVDLEDTCWVPTLVEVVDDAGRRIRPPTQTEAERAESARWKPQRSLGTIPEGAETKTLLRHGFRRWEDLYPRRQRVVMERMLSAIPDVVDDVRAQRAIETALIGVAEFAGYLSRWDARYLKPYEAIANHRYQATTFAVEPHVWGVKHMGRGTASARLKALSKAADWSAEKLAGRKIRVRRSLRRTSLGSETILVAGSAHRLGVPDGSLDLVLTDPPYHDDVQYAELAWLYQAWNGGVHRLKGDLTVGPNGTAADAYRVEMTKVFREVRRALKRDGHLILSYANREPQAWVSLIGALHDAGFRAVGVVAVMAENETDHAKTNRRAATYDLIIDVVSDDNSSIQQYRDVTDQTAQGRFLNLVADWVMQIGALEDGWEAQMRGALSDAEFIA